MLRKIVISVIKCACILHNFIRKTEGQNSEPMVFLEPSEVITTELNLTHNEDIPRNLNTATVLIDYISDYFVKPNASLPWQNNYTVRYLI